MKFINFAFAGAFIGVALGMLQRIFGSFVDQAPVWFSEFGVHFVKTSLAIGLIITVWRQPTTERFVNYAAGVVATCLVPFFIGFVSLGMDTNALSPSEIEYFCMAVMLIAAAVPVMAFFMDVNKRDLSAQSAST